LAWRYDAIQAIMMDFADAEVKSFNSGGWEWRCDVVVVGFRPMDTLES